MREREREREFLCCIYVYYARVCLSDQRERERGQKRTCPVLPLTKANAPLFPQEIGERIEGQRESNK